MTILRTFGVLLASMVVITLAGGGLGWAVGAWNPGYYRSVFSNGDQPQFDPKGVGLGLGLTQGLVGGLVIGVLLIAVLSWREVRLASPSGIPNTNSSDRKRIGCLGVAMIVAGVPGLPVAGLIGYVIRDSEAGNQQYVEEDRALQLQLKRDAMFANVSLTKHYARGVAMSGVVRSQADFHRLREVTIRGVGERRAAELLQGVWVQALATTAATSQQSSDRP